MSAGQETTVTPKNKRVFFFGCLNGPEKKIGFGKVQQRGLTRIDHTTLGDPYFSKGKLNVEENSFPSSSLGNTRQKKRVSISKI
jgi:hypothetical protein